MNVNVISLWLKAWFFALLVYLVWVASTLTLDYYDGYEILLNARTLATRHSPTYYWTRPLILPLILSPIHILEKAFPMHSFALGVSHQTMIGFFIFLIWGFYRLLRLDLSRAHAALGAFFLSLNPLLIHYAPFVKEDLMSATWTTAGFYFYWKSKKKRPVLYLFLSGLCLGLAMSSRYNLLPPIYLLLLVQELLTFTGQPRSLFLPVAVAETKGAFLLRFLCLFILPFGIFLLIPLFVYQYLRLANISQALEHFFTHLFFISFMNENLRDPLRNYVFLIKSCSWPVCVLAGAGAVVCVRKRSPMMIFFVLWFLIFFIWQTYFIGAKEARYLFPLFPPFYYFALLGFHAILETCMSRVQTNQARLLGFCLSLLILFLPFKSALAECGKFLDPIYRIAFAEKVGQYAAQLADKNQIYWFGHFYPLHPQDYLFDPKDDFAYVYHLHKHVIFYHTKRPIRQLYEIDFLMQRKTGEAYFLPLNSRRYFKGGDVLIFNREPSPYATSTLPEKIKPLVVERVSEVFFQPESDGTEGERVFRGEFAADAAIHLNQALPNFELRGEGITDGAYELYGFFPGEENGRSLGFVDVQGGQFVISFRLNQPSLLGKISLLSYDSMKEFALPASPAKERR